MYTDAWVCLELFPKAFNDYLHNDILGPINQWAKDNGLDFDTLLEFGPEKVLINIKADEKLKKKTFEKLEQSVQKWESWSKLTERCSMKNRVKLLNGDLSKRKSAILKDLLCERFPNEFCFLPHKARSGQSEIMTDGLVVNLKDIIQISPEEIEEIERNGFDCSEILKHENGNSELERLNAKYFLEHSDDFVMFDGIIKSPWIEHLLQNFSNAFARIGVETLSNSELSAFCDAYKVDN